MLRNCEENGVLLTLIKKSDKKTLFYTELFVCLRKQQYLCNVKRLIDCLG